MPVRKPIEREGNPDQGRLEELIRAQRPVIFTDLFAGDAAGRLRGRSGFDDRFADLALEVRPAYSADGFAAQRQAPEPLRMRYRDYVTMTEADPGTTYLCLEQPTPAPVAALFSLEMLAGINAGSGDRIQSNLFVGNAGNASNLHYDRDYHNTLLYQIYGRKRVVVIDPRQSFKLRPATNFSEYILGAFSREDLAEFLDYTSAWTDELQPGETLFIPAAYWHHIDYVDASVSVNFKLCRNKYQRLLGGGLFHSNHVVQALAARLSSLETIAPEHLNAFEAIIRILTSTGLSREDRFLALEQEFRRLYASWLPDWPSPDIIQAFDGQRELDLWQKELAAGLYRELPIAS